jgi:hypothetical protein
MQHSSKVVKKIFLNIFNISSQNHVTWRSRTICPELWKVSLAIPSPYRPKNYIPFLWEQSLNGKSLLLPMRTEEKLVSLLSGFVYNRLSCNVYTALSSTGHNSYPYHINSSACLLFHTSACTTCYFTSTNSQSSSHFTSCGILFIVEIVAALTT